MQPDPIATQRPRQRTVIATFSPHRLQDLSPFAVQHVGWRGPWTALWTLDDPTSRYYGQTIWWPTAENERFGLVPDEDLADVQEVDPPTAA
jgi:hypothetical protein